MKNYNTNGGSPENTHSTLEYSELGSLAARDVVARSCDQRMKITGAKNVWLITDRFTKELLHSNFPTIKRLNEFGLSLGKDPLPVAPAAHYMVGGLSRHPGQSYDE